MKWEWMKMIYKIRICMYVLGIAAFTIATLVKCAHASEIEQKCDTESSDDGTDGNNFWPPDIIPHPHIPGTGPSGPRDPDMA